MISEGDLNRQVTYLLHFDHSLSLACHSANCTVSHPNVSVLVSSGFKSKQYIVSTLNILKNSVCVVKH